MKPEDFWKLISNAKPPEPLTEASFEKLGLLEIWKMFDELEKNEQEPYLMTTFDVPADESEDI